MAEVPELDPDNDTSETLEVKLANYRRAIETEWKTADDATTEAGADNAEAFVQTFARQNLANNLAQLQWLAQNSMSDAVRANCAKYLIGLAREDAESEGDPMKDLINKLTKQPAPTTN